MDKQLIKTIIGENQSLVDGLPLVKRPMHFDPNANYVLVRLRREFGCR